MVLALLAAPARPAPAAVGADDDAAAEMPTVVHGPGGAADGCCPPAHGCDAGDCVGMAGCGVAPVLSAGTSVLGTELPMAARPEPDDASLPSGPDPDRAVPPPRA